MSLGEPFDLVAEAPRPPRMAPADTALLVIDLQYLDADPGYGLGLRARAQGREAALSYRFERVARILPNIQRLADACRAVGVKVIYIRIATALPDGSDGSPSLRGLHCLPTSREAEILEPIAPQPGDIVLTKSSLSAFTTSDLDQVLRNLGIRTLIGTGIVTNGCVELTMRDAADRGYYGVLVDDCCAANSAKLHQDALQRMDRGFLRVSTCDQVLRELRDTESEQHPVVGRRERQ